mmetsp:Transcript_107438/g.312399  ORF Transcript_107438/g.312399 Transcript_107438/m.312399 type:complete len:417 (+) Transcript_107438:161-1411(+)
MGRAHLWHALTAQPHAVPRDAHDGTLQRLCAGTRSGSKPRRQLGSLQSRLALGWQMGWLPTVVTRLAWSSRLARTACWLARISARSFSLLRAMRATSTSYLAWIRSRVSLARLSRARAFLRSSYVASASSAVSLLTREASLHLKISCRACLYATSMPVRALVSATRHFSSCLSSQAFASALIACRDARAACVLNEGTRSASIHSHSCIRPMYRDRADDFKKVISYNLFTSCHGGDPALTAIFIKLDDFTQYLALWSLDWRKEKKEILDFLLGSLRSMPKHLGSSGLCKRVSFHVAENKQGLALLRDESNQFEVQFCSHLLDTNDPIVLVNLNAMRLDLGLVFRTVVIVTACPCVEIILATVAELHCEHGQLPQTGFHSAHFYASQPRVFVRWQRVPALNMRDERVLLGILLWLYGA